MKEGFIIQEYNQLWNYYKETLANRKNLFDWYFKIVAIPASAFGIAKGIAQAVGAEVHQPFIPERTFAIVFFIIFLCGIGLFVAYCKESGNSASYLMEIDKIRIHIKEKYTIDTHFMSYNIYYNYWKCLKEVTFWRLVPIIVINSFLLSIGILFISQRSENISILVFLFMILLHSILYPVIYRTGMRHFTVPPAKEGSPKAAWHL